ncbi:MAG: paraslipin [Deltaproteobacteria bacterium]|jgi:regulator of protease activity HflC (stomatin/prohibitin superfamily)|nr:paraslipin [Deltaproteobacteria bacterium]
MGGEMSIFAIAFLVFAAVVLFKAVRIVPQQEVWILERLGKFQGSLSAGLHFVVPFVDIIRYRHSLKEIVLDIPAQVCITRDNVSVHIDGVLFFRVVDPIKSSYGINDYIQAVVQLAQTTLRSEIGKIDLDRTFEERDKVNSAVILAIDQATEPWGVKVLRYELKSIQPPKDVLDAMEKQMRAEREKRANVLTSEADRDSKINRAEGEKQETIKASEADRQKQINEAEGKAQAILAVANATAEGLRQVAIAMSGPGGEAAAKLKIAEEYVKQFGQVAYDARAIIVPSNVGDPSSMIATAMAVMDGVRMTSISEQPKGRA